MRTSLVSVLGLFLLHLPYGVAQTTRTPDADKQTILHLEEEWLHARDGATLDRILASDFVHPVPQGVFLTKAQHIDWYVHHLPRLERKTSLDHVQVRLYGETAIVNGLVIGSDEAGKELDRTIFTDVFVYRDGRWQAVNGQENRVVPRQ